MNSEVLSRDRILDTAEEVLRRFGPAKTTVLDVARALSVSHGTIYRHFPNKAALKDAVAERWLSRVSAPLEEIAQSREPAAHRLRRWLEALAAAKRRKVFDDPEMFATYHALAEQARGVVDAHVAELVGQLQSIIESGVREGVFAVKDSAQSAQGVFDATLRFHHPSHAREWKQPGIDRAFESVIDMLIRGLARTSA